MDEQPPQEIEKQQEIEEKEKKEEEVVVKKQDIICNSTNSLKWLVHQFFVRREYAECIDIL